MTKKLVFYIVRWQLSTFVLWPAIALFEPHIGSFCTAVLANFIGALIFFPIDRLIFSVLSKKPLWEIEENAVCVRCGYRGRGYRIVEWMRYDRKKDKTPQYRCEACSVIKMDEIRKSLSS